MSTPKTSTPKTSTGTRSTGWAALAAWRTENQPWTAVPGTSHPEVPTLVCACGRASYEHDPDLKACPAIDALTGATLCPGFDPVARLRRRVEWERQDAHPDRVGEQP